MSTTVEREEPPSLLSVPRVISFLTSILVAMASGSNYVFSAYGPQLGSRLHLTHTQISVVGLSGTVGVYGTAPLLGKLVDAHGPPIPLTIAFFALFAGYLGLRQFYVVGLPNESSVISPFSFSILLLFGLFTGIGANGGMASAINATAKSFPDHARTTTTSVVLSGFGLSAFIFSSIAHVAFPGDTPSFLLVLAIGTSLPMILGILFVRPIPPSNIPDHRHLERGQIVSQEDSLQDTTPSGIFRRETDARVPLLASQGSDGAPPFPRNEISQSDSVESNFVVPAAEGAVPLSRTTSYTRERGSTFAVSIGSKEAHPDIHGMALVTSVEFWLLFTVTTLLSGTALMYINNVGSISQALYATTTLEYDEIEAARWQASQVSTISISNCLGRIIIGLLVDTTKRFYGIRRPAFISLIAMLFILSQLTALYTSDIEKLWKASMLLGLSYGASVGLFPSITIDWFGLAHFSENWGFISLAPVLGGNIFSIAFGRILDAHSGVVSDIGSEGNGTVALGRCLEGRSCYADSFKLTFSACCLALGLGLYAAWRDFHRAQVNSERKLTARDQSESGEESAWVE